LREIVKTRHQRAQPRPAELALDQSVLLFRVAADESETPLAGRCEHYVQASLVDSRSRAPDERRPLEPGQDAGQARWLDAAIRESS
jgi:hypothetical protein